MNTMQRMAAWVRAAGRRKPTPRRTVLRVDGCEDRTVPSTVVYSGTSALGGPNGGLTVAQTVTHDAPGAEDRYTWEYQVTNLSYAPDPEVTDPYTDGWDFWAWFQLNGVDYGGVADLSSTNDWTPTATTTGGQHLIEWYSGTGYTDLAYIPVGGTAAFRFTTPPKPVVDVTAVYGDSIAVAYAGDNATGTVKGPGTGVGVAVQALADGWEAGPVPGAFEVTRVGGDLSQPLTAPLTVGGTATPGTDYTALPASVTFEPYQTSVLLAVTPKADNVADDGETVTLTVASGTGYVTSGTGSATVTIADDPVLVDISSTAREVTEGESLAVVFERVGGDVSQTLTIDVQIAPASGNDAATPGDDFTVSGASASGGLYQVTFAAGSATASIEIQATADETPEDTEWGRVEVVAGAGYTVVPVQAIEFALADPAPPPRPLKQALEARARDLTRQINGLQADVDELETRIGQQALSVFAIKAMVDDFKEREQTADQNKQRLQQSLNDLVQAGVGPNTPQYKEAAAKLEEAKVLALLAWGRRDGAERVHTQQTNRLADLEARKATVVGLHGLKVGELTHVRELLRELANNP